MAGIKSIGILTSGGDAPGMNAAIRAVTRSAIYNGFTVKGIMRGFKGLVFNEIVEFKSQSVSNIIQLGGTILKTARSEEFKTVEGRKAAYDNMVAAGIDALVVIGGDGSQTGAGLFAEEYNVPIVGLPGTIDNDLGGTDSTIGYDTALNTIMESVDKLRDTASSHERLFFVEVMGHTAGYLALNSAIATGSYSAGKLSQFADGEPCRNRDQQFAAEMFARFVESGFRILRLDCEQDDSGIFQGIFHRCCADRSCKFRKFFCCFRRGIVCTQLCRGNAFVYKSQSDCAGHFACADKCDSVIQHAKSPLFPDVREVVLPVSASIMRHNIS